MTTKRPSENSEKDGTSPSLAAVEAFDIALITGTFVALVVTYGSIKWGGLHSPVALVTIIVADAVFVFFIVPHATAYWLDCDIDALLTSDATHRR
ncbi:hypothetical protein [Halobellus marinus]|uniref:hypothetical protein n=1 Tax=Halobellus TaxID=1073986 RepID=UPI0028B0D04A|nr:hypothetical protein [Halobellus sp. DFY28]